MSEAIAQKVSNIWGGGNRPFGVRYGKMMMWFFLMSDTFTFATLLIVYGTLRFSSEIWPEPLDVFNTVPGLHGNNYPLVFVTIMTFILIVSSVTMVLAVYEGHHGNRKGVIKWMALTIIGGAAFLGCQALEWAHLIHEGLSLNFNPFGPNGLVTKEAVLAGTAVAGPVHFGQLFFFITGFHGTHVLSGVIINIIILTNTVYGVYEKAGDYEMIEKVGLYWHFVDLVWVFVFLLFYLI